MFNQNGLKVGALTHTALGLALGLMVVSIQPSHAQGLGSELSRLGQVFGRNNNVNNNLNYDRGQLGGNYNTLRAEQNGIQQQAQMDARANGGYITPQQQSQLNAEENNVRQQMRQDYTGQGSAMGHGLHFGGLGGFGGGFNNGYGNNGFGNGGGIFGGNRSGRAEVLNRDNNINRELNADRGQLGGNYQGLKAEDRAIKQQERAEARANGGYLTPGQQQQLNQEENMLQNQVRQDRHY